MEKAMDTKNVVTGSPATVRGERVSLNCAAGVIVRQRQGREGTPTVDSQTTDPVH